MEMAGLKYCDDPAAWRKVLAGLRILILHAGGDCRRARLIAVAARSSPAARHCGVVRYPFDRQLPLYFGFPAATTGARQIVIASGDVLLGFDPREVEIAPSGVTGLASPCSRNRPPSTGSSCWGANRQCGVSSRSLQSRRRLPPD